MKHRIFKHYRTSKHGGQHYHIITKPQNFSAIPKAAIDSIPFLKLKKWQIKTQLEQTGTAVSPHGWKVKEGILKKQLEEIDEKLRESEKKNFRMGFEHQYAFSDVASKDIKTVKMKPEEFLKMTFDQSRLSMIRSGETPTETFEEYKKDVILPEHVKFIKKQLKEDKPIAIPFLTFDKWWRPSGHEGRHTAQAATELGMEKIPVTIERRKFAWDWEKAPPKELIPLYKKNIGEYEHYPKQAVEKEFVWRKEDETSKMD